MKFCGILLYCCFFLIGHTSEAESAKTILCYYDSTSYWREEVGRFQARDIDPYLCSHIIYSFFGVKGENGHVYSKDPGLDLGPDEIEPFPDEDWNNRGDVDMLRQTVLLREINPEIKVLLSLGGPSQPTETFSSVAKDTGKRTQLVQSLVDCMERFDLDGTDIYWSYPEGDEDKRNFVELVKDVRSAFNTLATTTGKNYTLTVATGCTQSVIDNGYNVLQMQSYVNFFNVLCFDFKQYAPDEAGTPQLVGHHSPLNHKQSEPADDQKLTVNFGVSHFLRTGVAPAKVVLGVSSHARTFELRTPSENDFYDEVNDAGQPGEFTQTKGFLGYFEICAMIKQNATGWEFRYDYEYSIPYAIKALLWVGYENEISIQEKVDFAVQKNLGGLAMKSLDLDDSKNDCGAWFAFPLTSFVKERLEFHDAY